MNTLYNSVSGLLLCLPIGGWINDALWGTGFDPEGNPSRGGIATAIVLKFMNFRGRKARIFKYSTRRKRSDDRLYIRSLVVRKRVLRLSWNWSSGRRGWGLFDLNFIGKINTLFRYQSRKILCLKTLRPQSLIEFQTNCYLTLAWLRKLCSLEIWVIF